MDTATAALRESTAMLRWLITRHEDDLRAWIYAWKLLMIARRIEVVDTAS